MTDEKKVANSMVFEMRCDIRTLAGLVRYFRGKGINIDTRSKMGSLMVESLMAILEKGGKASAFKSASEAHMYLETLGLAKRHGKRGMKAFMKQVMEEEVDINIGDEETEEQVRNIVMRRVTGD